MVQKEYGLKVMAKKRFTRGQTQILYRYLPGAIFSHDDYGLCKVNEVIIEDAEKINQSALFDTLIETLSQWQRPEFRDQFPDPRELKNRRLYKYGQPREVLFDPYPTILQCKKCKTVTEYSRINKKGIQPGVCTQKDCNGHFVQLGYVEAHNCGRMKELHIWRCSKHGNASIKFNDTGRAQTSTWYCGICGENQKLRMTPCACAYSNVVDELRRSKYDKYLHVYSVTDPGLYSPHVVAFINFPEEEEKKLSQGLDITYLLLARVWEILDGSVLDLLSKRKQFSLEGSEGWSELEEIVKALEEINPEHPKVLEYRKRMEKPPGQNEINTVKDLLGKGATNADAPSRKLVEHVALRDKMNLTSIDTVCERLVLRGRAHESEDYRRKAQNIFDDLGIQKAFIINDFPIALTALGYTRVTKDTKRSLFNPFTVGEDGKIPLYVIPTETEGLWFHLDPIRVLSWLIDNGLSTGGVPSNKAEAWARLHQEALRHILNQATELPSAAYAVHLLIHTISHLFLRCVEWSGFGSSSVGEYLMPGTLSFVVYANRFTESKIGGLTTLFEQRLPLWLMDVYQSGRSCIYDPLCEEDGGACVGCLHREFNCPYFNNDLSRSCLYGGLLPDTNGMGMTLIHQGFWE